MNWLNYFQDVFFSYGTSIHGNIKKFYFYVSKLICFHAFTFCFKLCYVTADFKCSRHAHFHLQNRSICQGYLIFGKLASINSAYATERLFLCIIHVGVRLLNCGNRASINHDPAVFECRMFYKEMNNLKIVLFRRCNH